MGLLRDLILGLPITLRPPVTRRSGPAPSWSLFLARGLTDLGARRLVYFGSVTSCHFALYATGFDDGDCQITRPHPDYTGRFGGGYGRHAGGTLLGFRRCAIRTGRL